MTGAGDAPRVQRYDEVPYVDELTILPEGAPATVLERARAAAEAGVRRKQVTTGELGLFSHVVEFPPGYEVPLHSHDHDEIIVILEGSCTMMDGGGIGDGGADGATLGPSDMAFLKAEVPYGFTAGPRGLKFLNIRQGLATIDISS